MRYRYIYKYKTGLTKVKTRLAIAISVLGLGASGIIGSLAFFGAAHAAVSSNYSLFGDASIVSGGNTGNAAQATSTGTTGYGGVDFGVPAGVTTVSSLSNLATDYKFTAGSCGSGSPRFSVNVSNGTTTGNIFFYLGPAPNYSSCPPNTWTNSGNLASPANLVDATQIGGTFYEPYATVQATYGSYVVKDVALVVDGPNQTTLFDNTQADSNTYTYDQPVNSDQCKNDGWMSLTDGNGNSFKNQGQCVSYAQHTNGVGQDDVHAKAVK